ncbi:hypothetical protein CRYUN_Cryun05aG0026600 [Craigia yunnanensis]
MKRISISIMLLACLVASAAAQSASDVTAYWTDYKVTKTNWDLNAAHVFCASVDGDKPLDWRSKYGWTGYCGTVGPQGEEACGKCLSLDLETAFKPIDTDGKGFAQGHLVVDYKFVDCEAVPGPGESDVTAYWTDYNVKKNNWDYHAAHVFCAALDGDKPLEWRSKYGWTGFCGKVGPQGDEACGKCLKITNTDTKDEEIVRIVDKCGSGGLELDLETAFNPIDTDGKGHEQGHLIVDYEFVDCGDSSLENTVLVYSQ